MSRDLQSKIHSDFNPSEEVWYGYRESIETLFNSSYSKSDFNDHLIREYNRKINRLDQNDYLYIKPYDAGFRFKGATFDPLMSLNIQFAKDRSFTKPSYLGASETKITSRKGPSPIFTRATAATMVGSNGLVQYAPENLILQSNDFKNDPYLLQGLSLGKFVSDPFDGMTAREVIFSSTPEAKIHQAVSDIYNSSVTFSFWARADSPITIFTRMNNEAFTTINLTTQWARYSYTYQSITQGTLYPEISSANGGAKTFYLYGLQLERSPIARQYIPTTSSRVYGPRFHYNPNTLSCEGLLIEENKINKLLHTSIFESSAWTTYSDVTITKNAIRSPMGLMDANKISLNQIKSTLRRSISQQVYVSGGKVHTLSFFCKAGERGVIQVAFTGRGSYFYGNFVVAGEFAGSTSHLKNSINVINAKMEPYPDGWYRCSFSTAALEDNFTTVHFVIVNSKDSVRFEAVKGTDGHGIYLWGVQYEEGHSATSYIPTSSLALARSPDICSITGSDFANFYNVNEGSFAASAIFKTSPYFLNNQTIFDINDSTSLNRTSVFKSKGQEPTEGINYQNHTNGILNVGISGLNHIADEQVTKIAGSIKKDDFVIYVNNALEGADNEAVIQSNPTTFSIGKASDQFATRSHVNGTIDYIQYYRKRLSDAKLQELTL